ncbi:hypothetical protein H5410_046646 [Solanum commersonii]|uniref:Uncharacterized protein n=1 Tax=Solanum commersonii TaxID=4109 RepID=A0A9J5XG31_SOLCO|nr:hypothetical protein H5410_046646 [Solanum commersonii]
MRYLSTKVVNSMHEKKALGKWNKRMRIKNRAKVDEMKNQLHEHDQPIEGIQMLLDDVNNNESGSLWRKRTK